MINLTILALLALNIVFTAYLGYKIIKTHRLAIVLRKEARNTAYLYRQIQAYQDLARLVDTKWPLPPLGRWAASPDFLMVTATHALESNPQLIVECGSGASTIVLARCCQKSGKGRVVSFDHEERFAEKTRNELKRQGLADFATVLYAPLQPYPELNNQNWYALDEKQLLTDGIDMLIVDGPPAKLAPLARYPALPLLKPYMNLNVKIFMDDAAREQEKVIIDRWKKEFPGLHSEVIAAEKGCVILHQEPIS